MSVARVGFASSSKGPLSTAESDKNRFYVVRSTLFPDSWNATTFWWLIPFTAHCRKLTTVPLSIPNWHHLVPLRQSRNRHRFSVSISQNCDWRGKETFVICTQKLTKACTFSLRTRQFTLAVLDGVINNGKRCLSIALRQLLPDGLASGKSTWCAVTHPCKLPNEAYANPHVSSISCKLSTNPTSLQVIWYTKTLPLPL